MHGVVGQAGFTRAFAGGNYVLESSAYREQGAVAGEAPRSWTRKTMDQSGRLVQVAVNKRSEPPAPWGTGNDFVSVTSYSYPAPVGNRVLVTETDAAGKVRTEYRDGLGRLVQVVQGSAGVAGESAQAEYWYNGRDQLTRVLEYDTAGTKARTFVYDSVGRLSSTVQPESGSTSYTYFADGQLKRKTDAAGLYQELSYDGAHRMSRKTLSTGEVIDYCYDGKVYGGSGCVDLSGRSADGLDYPKGRLTGVGSAGGWTNHLQVDALGRTLKVEQKAADLAVKTLEYTYATNGFVKTMKYPSGRVVTFAQTAAGRTLSASGNGVGEQYASGLQYGANGAMVGAVWNGTGATRLVEARSYNWLGQMVTAEVSKAGTELKWKITNEYGNENNNGNLNKQWTETGVATYGVKFAYDSVNRIRGAAEDAANEAGLAAQSCSVVGGTWCVKYRADGYGNLWTENKSATAAGVAAVSQAAYDAATNRMTAAGYYANGNQKYWVLNEPKSRAEYDADGKMVKAGRVTLNDGTTWDAAQVMTTLTYNGAGQRVKKTVTQGAATQTVHYVYGLDGEVAAEWESAPTGVSGRQFLVGDHLGSTRVRLDVNGEPLQRIDYEPFGTEVQRPGVSGYSGSGEVARKFTGKERDGETGLDYFGARYLGSALGRFTSPDPLLNSGRPWDVRSWNRYSYTLNSPMIFVDPTGLYEYGTCNGTEDQCKQAKADFETALEKASKASKNLKDGNARNAINDSLKSIGKLGDKNGVKVNFDFKGAIADTKQTGSSQVITLENGRLGRVQEIALTINPSLVGALASLESLDYGATFAQLVAHEGVHIPQARINGDPPRSFDEYFRREFPAYTVGSYVNEGLNRNAPFGLWNTSWANSSDKEQFRSQAIKNVIGNFGASLSGKPAGRAQ